MSTDPSAWDRNLERVRAAAATVACRPAAGIAPQDRILEDLGIDSLDFVLLVRVVEQECGCPEPLDDSTAAEARTVGDLVDLVTAAQSGPRPG